MTQLSFINRHTVDNFNLLASKCLGKLFKTIRGLEEGQVHEKYDSHVSHRKTKTTRRLSLKNKRHSVWHQPAKQETPRASQTLVCRLKIKKGDRHVMTDDLLQNTQFHL